MRRGPALLLSLGLAGCATPPPVREPALTALLLERVRVLERRVAELERHLPPRVRTYPASGPGQAADRDAEQALENLRSMRRELLGRYTARHPDVLLLDREIQRIEQGLPPPAAPLREVPTIPAEPPAP